jgi:replicative DNA helicase
MVECASQHESDTAPMRETILSHNNHEPEPIRLPRNIEAEAALLGAMMIDNRILDRVADLVSPKDFFEPLYSRIYETMMTEAASGRNISPVSLKPFFETDPAMIELGGPGYLVQLTADGSGLAGSTDFAKQIRDLASLRGLVGAGQQLIERACDTSSDIDPKAIVEELDSAFTTLLQPSVATKSLSISNAWEHALTEVENERAGIGPPVIKFLDFEAWNALFGGQCRVGEVTILAGRPGMGKTAAAIKVALSSGASNIPCLFISLEMTIRSLMERVIAGLCYEDEFTRNISLEVVKKGVFDSSDRRRIDEVRTQIADWPVTFTDPPSMKLGRLAMTIRRYKRMYAAKGQELRVVVIDYLQLIKPDRLSKSRYEDVGLISRTIKEIAKDCSVHIVLLSQLSRGVEGREDKRPQLHDLRDAGDIEQDADNVIFVYREQYYLEKAEPPKHTDKHVAWCNQMQQSRDKMELIARKVRQGQTSTQSCSFLAAYQAIRDHENEGSPSWR